MQCYDLLPAPVRRQLQEMCIDVQNLPLELINAIANGWAPPPDQIVADLRALDARLRAELAGTPTSAPILRDPRLRNPRA